MAGSELFPQRNTLPPFVLHTPVERAVDDDQLLSGEVLSKSINLRSTFFGEPSLDFNPTSPFCNPEIRGVVSIDSLERSGFVLVDDAHAVQDATDIGFPCTATPMPKVGTERRHSLARGPCMDASIHTRIRAVVSGLVSLDAGRNELHGLPADGAVYGNLGDLQRGKVGVFAFGRAVPSPIEPHPLCVSNGSRLHKKILSTVKTSAFNLFSNAFSRSVARTRTIEDFMSSFFSLFYIRMEALKKLAASYASECWGYARILRHLGLRFPDDVPGVFAALPGIFLSFYQKGCV